MAILHPIFSVLIHKPELVFDHVAGYAALVQEEASSVGGEVAKRVIAWAVAGVGAIVFLVLAGVSAMLGVMQDEFHWILLVVPAIPLVLALLAWNVACKRLPSQAFAELKAQLDADAQTLRTLGAQS